MTGVEIAAIASAVATVGSTVSSMGAQRAQAKGEIAKSQYDEANARRETALNIQKETREQNLRAGRQLSQAAGQGAGLSGNILDIMADTAYQSELSVLGMRDNMMLAQTAGASERSNIKSSAKSAQMGSLLSGAAQLGSIGMSYYNSPAATTTSTVPKPGRNPFY